MKQIVMGLLGGVLLLTACGQTTPIVQTTAISVDTITSTSSPIPATTATYFPTKTHTPSTTPLPTIPTFTPTFDKLIQPNPFPADTPNPTALAIAQEYNSLSALISPNNLWAAIENLGQLKVVQMHGGKEYIVNCGTFLRCEFITPLQWSSDSSTLYFAPLLTGETDIPFPLYTGIARMNITTGQLEKLAKDSVDEMEYNISLSPNGNYLVFTDIKESHPSLTIIDTKKLKEITKENINYGIAAGNILWTQSSKGIVFVSVISCESSIYFLDLNTKTLSVLLEKDPTCIKLLFIDEKNQVALSKFTYNPITNSYWWLDLTTKEITQILSIPK